jgi:drug/metabolite transporter (DMT)-like permease
MTAHHRARASIAACVTILFWASAYPAIRVGLRVFSPGQLAALRFLIATVLFAVYLAWRRTILPRGRELVRVAVAGAVGIAAYNLLLNTGELTVSAGAASFLINCMPVFASLLAILFLGERLSPMGWLGIAISMTGVFVIASADELHFGRGAFLIVGAAFCSALMGLLQKPLMRSYSPPAITACLMGSGALLLSPFLPAALRLATQPGAHDALLAAVFLGVAPAALGYLAWSIVLQHFTLSQTANLLYLIPVVAVLISYVWLHERLSTLSLAGGALAIAGVVVLHRFGRSSPAAMRHAPATAD